MSELHDEEQHEGPGGGAVENVLLLGLFGGVVMAMRVYKEEAMAMGLEGDDPMVVMMVMMMMMLMVMVMVHDREMGGWFHGAFKEFEFEGEWW